MIVRKLSEAKPYEAPNHRDYKSLRVFGAEMGGSQTLVFGISLHPFIVGQPFRLRPVKQAIKHCVEHKGRDRVWFTRAGEIAKYCFTLPKGVVPGS